MKSKYYSFFEKFIFPFSLAVAILCFIASLSPFVSPASSWIIALFGLAFPFLFTVNLFSLFFWIFKKKWLVLFPAVPFIIGFNTAEKIFETGLFRPGEPDSSQVLLKTMNFNVRNFDVYNWTGNWFGTARVREQIFELISKESPDLLCIQEFFTSDSGKFQTLKAFKNELGYKNAIVELPLHLSRKDHWGMAIFSKHELLNKKMVQLSSDGLIAKKSLNMMLLADMIFNTDTFRVINCHLQSIRFQQEDYKFMSDVGINIEDENLRGVKNITRRLRIAFQKRSRQVDTLCYFIRQSPYPVILCGDFNDTPSSFAYRKINSLLSDAFLESGRGLGTTYIGPFPAFRIDYIFHSPQFGSSGFEVLNKKLSDHYPIQCTIRINKDPNRL